MPPNDEQVPQDDRLLDDSLLKAHALDDLGALVWLYLEAANSAIDDEAAQGFYLTHAYIYALEAGLEDGKQIKARLIALNREIS